MGSQTHTSIQVKNENGEIFLHPHLPRSFCMLVSQISLESPLKEQNYKIGYLLDKINKVSIGIKKHF